MIPYFVWDYVNFPDFSMFYTTERCYFILICSYYLFSLFEYLYMFNLLYLLVTQFIFNLFKLL